MALCNVDVSTTAVAVAVAVAVAMLLVEGDSTLNGLTYDTCGDEAGEIGVNINTRKEAGYLGHTSRIHGPPHCSKHGDSTYAREPTDGVCRQRYRAHLVEDKYITIFLRTWNIFLISDSTL